MNHKLTKLLIRIQDEVSNIDRLQTYTRAADNFLDDDRTIDASEMLNAYVNSVNDHIRNLVTVTEEAREELALLLNHDLIVRAKRHLPLLKAIPNAVVITLHDANEENEFYYLDVFTTTPQRLNRPKHELIGKPIAYLPPPISQPRLHHVKKAVENGQCERYSYEYRDTHLWRFNVTVAPLYGTEEVITIVEDAEPWQTEYWANFQAKD